MKDSNKAILSQIWPHAFTGIITLIIGFISLFLNYQYFTDRPGLEYTLVENEEQHETQLHYVYSVNVKNTGDVQLTDFELFLRFEDKIDALITYPPEYQHRFNLGSDSLFLLGTQEIDIGCNSLPTDANFKLSIDALGKIDMKTIYITSNEAIGIRRE